MGSADAEPEAKADPYYFGGYYGGYGRGYYGGYGYGLGHYGYGRGLYGYYGLVYKSIFSSRSTPTKRPGFTSRSFSESSAATMSVEKWIISLEFSPTSAASFSAVPV